MNDTRRHTADCRRTRMNASASVIIFSIFILTTRYIFVFVYKTGPCARRSWRNLCELLSGKLRRTFVPKRCVFTGAKFAWILRRRRRDVNSCRSTCYSGWRLRLRRLACLQFQVRRCSQYKRPSSSENSQYITLRLIRHQQNRF